jgi:hypothetical protein
VEPKVHTDEAALDQSEDDGLTLLRSSREMQNRLAKAATQGAVTCLEAGIKACYSTTLPVGLSFRRRVTRAGFLCVSSKATNAINSFGAHLVDIAPQSRQVQSPRRRFDLLE